MNKLKKITKEELNKIIENHKHWLKEDCEGWENMKADLSYADLNKKDLSFTDLRGVTLSHANLSNADLSCSNLKGATLSYVDLSYANLYSAKFYKANLRFANLSHVNLRFANLRSANLENANFENANLMSATLSDAYLNHADLNHADLRCADLSNANLRYASLENAKINYPFACPVEGAFTAWKKADNKIVKLQILEDSKRLSATTDKCRCDKALVLEVQDLEGNKLDIESVSSDYDEDLIYKVGEIVEVKDFDENRWNECSTGIHFFVDRQMAVDY